MLAALATSLALSGQPAVGPPPEITVRLYQPFGSASETAAVEAAVHRIFSPTGIEVRWADCSAPSESWPSDSPCHHPATSGQVILRLLETHPQRPPCSQGTALVPPNGAVGVFATLYLSEVERFHRKTQTSRAELLGLFAAHEIGHLLLSAGHSANGIMRARWTPRDLEPAVRSQQTFSKEEAERMRHNLLNQGKEPR
jgi:hypothetical protein